MQISDIVSPTYSVNSNVLKLNSSSVAASTPSCEVANRQLVDFEEFSELNFHLPPRAVGQKKRLTIDIDEINDFQQQAVQKIEVAEEEKSSSRGSEQFEMRISHQKVEKTTARGESELQERIRSLTNRIKDLERGQEELVKENQQMKYVLQKKDELLQMKQRLVEDLTDKLAEFESESIQDKFYDEKLREKEAKYRDLQKVHEKIVAMNKSLQRELRESEKKIMELEKEVQKSVCATQYENMMKVKESSIKLKESSLKMLNPAYKENKQNTFVNTVKSLDKKKTTTQPKKPTRIASSTLNFAKKLQIRSPMI